MLLAARRKWGSTLRRSWQPTSLECTGKAHITSLPPLGRVMPFRYPPFTPASGASVTVHRSCYCPSHAAECNVQKALQKLHYHVPLM